MPNQIIVGDSQYMIDKDYVAGALHARVGLKTLFKNNGTHQWLVGERNESSRQHLRFGVDLVTEPDTGRVFEEDHEYGATHTTVGRYGAVHTMSWANFTRDLLIACGAFHAFGHIVEERGPHVTPGDMRKALAERGIWVSTDHCGVISHLRYNEARMAEASLSDDEIEKIENLKEPQRRILEICYDLHEKDWRSNPKSDTVSWYAKRSSGWSTSTVAKMEQDGLAGHRGLIRATGNGWIEISAKGLLAVRHIRARDAELGLEGLAPAKAMPSKFRW